MAITTITKGCDFTLRFAAKRIGINRYVRVSFVEISNIIVNLVSLPSTKTPVSHSIDEQGRLVVDIAGENLDCNTYGIEINGFYNNGNWRHQIAPAFEIVMFSTEDNYALNESDNLTIDFEIIVGETYASSRALAGTMAEHDAAQTAHPYILQQLATLAHTVADIATAAAGGIATHNTSNTAHQDIRESVANLNTAMQSAETAILALQTTIMSAGKVDDVQIDGTSILNNKIANIDSTQFGKVDDVKVNGSSVVSNKEANITVPTKVSDLDNDENYATETQVNAVADQVSEVASNIPTKVSDLDNDSDFITESEAEQMVEDAASEITIGTTTTGEPGTEAEVTNSGTTKAPILNFTIPRGEQGLTGPAGPEGPQGDSVIVGQGDLPLVHTFGNSTEKAASQKCVGNLLSYTNKRFVLIDKQIRNEIVTEGSYNYTGGQNCRIQIPKLEVGKTYVFIVEVQQEVESTFGVYLYINTQLGQNTNVSIGVINQGQKIGIFEYSPEENTNYRYLGFWNADSQVVSYLIREKTNLKNEISSYVGARITDLFSNLVYTGQFQYSARTNQRNLVYEFKIGETYVFNCETQDKEGITFFLYINSQLNVNTYVQIGSIAQGYSKNTFEYTPQEGTNYQYLGFWSESAHQISVEIRKKIPSVSEIYEELLNIQDKYSGKTFTAGDMTWVQGNLLNGVESADSWNARTQDRVKIVSDFNLENNGLYSILIAFYNEEGTFLSQVGINAGQTREFNYNELFVEDKVYFRLVYWDPAKTNRQKITPEIASNAEITINEKSILDKKENKYGNDYSDVEAIEIPIPRTLPKVNLMVSALPTTKTSNRTGYIDYQCDLVHFKKPIVLNCQGNSSMNFTAQRNLAVDIDDGSTIKFGNWVAQDSFHLKCYWIDVLRGYNNIAYNFVEEVIRYKDCRANRNVAGATSSNGSGIFGKDFDPALCHPDGFPIEVYLNGNYQGLYTWNLKKHRDNYSMGKNDYSAIHLDGEINDSTFFDGTIDWTKFEIRNPKKLILTDGETEYDGEDPHEIIGTNSAAYDAENTNIYNTAITKAAIERLSQARDQISAASAENRRSVFEQYFDVEMMKVYLVLSNALDNVDGFNKNWQWLCYNGKWSPNFYDMDTLFGRHWTGAFVYRQPEVSLNLSANTTSLMGWFNTLYSDDIKALWAELRDNKIISTTHIMEYVYDWVDRIGSAAYARNIEKWPQIPSYREDYPATNYTDGSSTYSVANRGMYDSPARIKKWLEAHIAYIDGLMNYNQE